MIIAGFADGSVSVWDLRTSSPLLHSFTNGGNTSVLLPHTTFSAHASAVTGLAVCQTFPHLFATCSSCRSLRVWDMRVLDSPVFHQHSRSSYSTTSEAKADQPDNDNMSNDTGMGSQLANNFVAQTGNMRRVAWATALQKFYTCADECYSFQLNRVCEYHVRQGIIRRGAAAVHNASVWDISVNDWMNVLASCDSAGFLIISQEKPKNSKGVHSFRTPLMETELCTESEDCQEDLAVEQKDSSSDIQNNLSSCSRRQILYKDFDTKWKCPRRTDQVKLLPSDPLITANELALHKVAWNPNSGCHRWLAVGGQAGMLRVLPVIHVGKERTSILSSYCNVTGTKSNSLNLTDAAAIESTCSADNIKNLPHSLNGCNSTDIR